MYSPGPSQWAFDGDCRWLWLDSAFVLSSRIIHTTWIYPRTIYPPFLGFYFFNGLMFLLQALHIFWAGLILRMVIKFLPGNVWTAAFNFPSICPTTLSPRTSNFAHLMVVLLFLFDILPDRTSSRTSGATRRRPRRMKMEVTIASGWKNVKTATCRTATLPSTTTTVKGTEWTVRAGDLAVWGVMTGPHMWPSPESQRTKCGMLRGSAGSTHKYTHTFIYNPVFQCG